MGVLNAGVRALAANTTMRGVMWQGNVGEMAVVNMPRPVIQEATDVIVRLTTAAICGTDLHIYHGVYGSADAPWPVGHEGVGIIEEAGDAVSGFAVGDHVIIPDNQNTHMTTLIPETTFGPGLGNDHGLGYGGTQSQYLRIPDATGALIAIPEPVDNLTMPDSEYVFVSDIWATSWVGLTWSGFQPGETVVIFGAGPVGMLGALSAKIRGASRTYIVDRDERRLALAQEHTGAIPINFAQSDPVNQILGLEPNGVNRVVDCVGYEAVNAEGANEPNIILRQAVAVLASRGGLGGVGIYNAQPNTTGTPLGAIHNNFMPFPTADFFSKGLSWRSEGVDVHQVAAELVTLIASGQAKPSFIVSATIGLEEAPEYYARFNEHKETKVLIQF
ncbi:alcohol dehydrogenase [Xylariaceae sp. FL1272]|nr:alcohol dehydrogenase [Xylariaceae sp. FL1272]